MGKQHYMSASAIGLVQPEKIRPDVISVPRKPRFPRLLGFLTHGGVQTVAINHKGEASEYSPRWTGAQICTLAGTLIGVFIMVILAVLSYSNSNTATLGELKTQISVEHERNVALQRTIDDLQADRLRSRAQFETRLHDVEVQQRAFGALGGIDPATLQKLTKLLKDSEPK